MTTIRRSSPLLAGLLAAGLLVGAAPAFADEAAGPVAPIAAGEHLDATTRLGEVTGVAKPRQVLGVWGTAEYNVWGSGGTNELSKGEQLSVVPDEQVSLKVGRVGSADIIVAFDGDGQGRYTISQERSSLAGFPLEYVEPFNGSLVETSDGHALQIEEPVLMRTNEAADEQRAEIDVRIDQIDIDIYEARCYRTLPGSFDQPDAPVGEVSWCDQTTQPGAVDEVSTDLSAIPAPSGWEWHDEGKVSESTVDGQPKVHIAREATNGSGAYDFWESVIVPSYGGSYSVSTSMANAWTARQTAKWTNGGAAVPQKWWELQVDARWYQRDGEILDYTVTEKRDRSNSASKHVDIKSKTVTVDYDPGLRREVIKVKYKVQIPYQWGDYEARYEYPEFTFYR